MQTTNRFVTWDRQRANKSNKPHIEGCDKLTKIAHVLDACVEIEAWEFTSVVKKN
jgi:hypothetical protein